MLIAKFCLGKECLAHSKISRAPNPNHYTGVFSSNVQVSELYCKCFVPTIFPTSRIFLSDWKDDEAIIADTLQE
jgi:hypothetical protein